jgi:hypothetical protein
LARYGLITIDKGGVLQLKMVHPEIQLPNSYFTLDAHKAIRLGMGLSHFGAMSGM